MDSQDRQELANLISELHENNKGWDILEEIDFSAGHTHYWGYNLAIDVMEGYRDSLLEAITVWLTKVTSCNCNRNSSPTLQNDPELHYTNCPADIGDDGVFEAEEWQKDARGE